MPIFTAVPIEVFDQDAYHAVDRRVTGFAFDIHNEFGRFLDEKLYQNELARRCEVVGFDVVPELQITMSLNSFDKNYYPDLLINRGVIIETKAVAALGPVHKGQTLNYLFMCGLHHGTLLNFRSERVEREFVSTRLTSETRRQVTFHADHWKQLTPQCLHFRELLLTCLAEWGAYLDPHLYRDAVTYFLGDKDQVLHDVPVFSTGTVIGTQQMHLLTDEVAFSVTASTHQPQKVLEHLQRFLDHTRLKALHWLNLNHGRIELRTIERT
jgi:GxxExxY protein